MTQEEKAKAYDEALERARKLYNSEETSADVEIACETIFPELAESEDEKIRKALIDGFTVMKESKNCGKTFSNHNIPVTDILAWLEKQGEQKSAVWSDKDENMLKSIIATCELAEQDRDSSPAKHLLEMQTNWLKSLKQRIHVSPAKTCENDTLLDLLHKMPSYITVDEIDYHFVMKKTVFYKAYYKGEGEEGKGNAIFGVTAFSPIDLLTAMLEKLKKEGLLE